MAEIESAHPPDVRRHGWLTPALSAFTLACGWALAYGQQVNIRAGWNACFTQLGDLDAGGNFGATLDAAARLLLYPLVLLATALPAWLLGRKKRIGLLTYALTLIVIGGCMFWFDYAHHNLLLAGDWQSGCPSGTPTGWPTWLGIHPSN